MRRCFSALFVIATPGSHPRMLTPFQLSRRTSDLTRLVSTVTTTRRAVGCRSGSTAPSDDVSYTIRADLRRRPRTVLKTLASTQQVECVRPARHLQVHGSFAAPTAVPNEPVALHLPRPRMTPGEFDVITPGRVLPRDEEARLAQGRTHHPATRRPDVGQLQDQLPDYHHRDQPPRPSRCSASGWRSRRRRSTTPGTSATGVNPERTRTRGRRTPDLRIDPRLPRGRCDRAARGSTSPTTAVTASTAAVLAGRSRRRSPSQGTPVDLQVLISDPAPRRLR